MIRPTSIITVSWVCEIYKFCMALKLLLLICHYSSYLSRGELCVYFNRLVWAVTGMNASLLGGVTQRD